LPKLAIIPMAITFVVVFSAVGWAVWRTTGLHIMFAASLVFGLLSLPRFFAREVAGARMVAVVLSIGTLVAAFAIGQDLADRKKYLTAPSHIVRTANGEVEGVLIRAGERGLLFKNTSTGQLGLIRWDSVKEVVTKESLPKDRKPEPWLPPLFFWDR
jgi:hypothetical protein